ncbi:hypothetical protein ACWEOO_18935 [Kribbella sp. NPDC004138]
MALVDHLLGDAADGVGEGFGVVGGPVDEAGKHPAAEGADEALEHLQAEGGETVVAERLGQVAVGNQLAGQGFQYAGWHP